MGDGWMTECIHSLAWRFAFWLKTGGSIKSHKSQRIPLRTIHGVLVHAFQMYLWASDVLFFKNGLNLGFVFFQRFSLVEKLNYVPVRCRLNDGKQSTLWLTGWVACGGMPMPHQARIVHTFERGFSILYSIPKRDVEPGAMPF